MREWKRILNKKTAIVIIFCVFANITLFLYQQFGGRSIAEVRRNNKEYAQLVKQYQDMDMQEAAAQIQERIREYNKSVQDGQATQETADIEILKSIKTKLNYLIGYHQGVEDVINNADNLKKKRLFSNKNSYAYANILRTAEDFGRVLQVQVTLNDDRGTEAFLSYEWTNYFVMALLLMMIYAGLKERENGMWQLVHCSPGGRAALAVKRLIFIWIFAFAVQLLFYAATWMASMLFYGGASSLLEPVQTMEAFSKFTLCCNKAQYLILLYVLSGFLSAALATIVWACFILFRNRNNPLIGIVLFVGLEFLLYQKIGTQSPYRLLHFVNVVNLLNVQDLVSSYGNWGFGLHVFSVKATLFSVLLILSVLAASFSVVWYAYMRPYGRTSLVSRAAAQLHAWYQKIFTRYPVILKEVHKLIFTGKGVLVLVLVLVLSGYFCQSGHRKFSEAQQEYDQMYLEHGGQDYSYIEEEAKQKQQAYMLSQQKLAEAAEQYEAQLVSEETYLNAVNEVQYYQSAVARISEYLKKLQYLEHIETEYGVQGWMISDRGYAEIFGTYSRQREMILAMLMVTGIMLVISGGISLEYRTRMNVIVSSSANGRKWIYVRRVFADLLLTTALIAIIYWMDMVQLYRTYGMPYLDAPVMSLPFVEESLGTGILSLQFVKNAVMALTIRQLLVIRLCIRAGIGIAVMAAAIGVSKMTAKKVNAFVVPVVLIFMLLLVGLFTGYLKIF